jgi:hypothetical protein
MQFSRQNVKTFCASSVLKLNFGLKAYCPLYILSSLAPNNCIVFKKSAPFFQKPQNKPQAQ